MRFFASFLAVLLQLAGTFSYEDRFMRLEAQIIRLENPQGLTASGRPCGGPFSTRQCHTVVSAHIDTEASNRIQYGVEDYGRTGDYQDISTSRDDNDPHIGQIVSRDICGKSLEKRAVVRVRAFDQDQGISGDRRINDFICELYTHNIPVHSVWSPVQLCQPEFQTTKMRLYFRYRVTRLEENQCRDHELLSNHYPRH